jgi:hypothetical protein
LSLTPNADLITTDQKGLQIALMSTDRGEFCEAKLPGSTQSVEPTAAASLRSHSSTSSLLLFSRKISKKCQKVAFSLEKSQEQPISHDPCITK